MIPDSFADFLGLLVLGWFLPGIGIAASLETLWPWWEQTTGKPIRPHDKVLVAMIAPPIITLLAWGIGAGLGYFPFTIEAAWGALKNGIVAAGGGQVAFGVARKLTTPPAQTINNTTTVGSIAADRDVYLGSTINQDDDPLHGGTV